ncbi:DUF4270 family protein [Carboxylicivirga sp. M1479]|uniref:DUF4270 family protein n=1 Tax=Carboxylicivirga sp. M1479 TaxID=2594476 RepID=UPI001178A6E1|nr:DUF4270 family protein [Carboxylicivirga sp. M1479]TRX70407.1 DUF4270 domain-containing protein [Carboxylicivirga sp. M1479]
MHQLRFISSRLFLITTLAFLLMSCQKGELNLGDHVINSSTYTTLIDTVYIQLSTIKEDSISTLATSNAIVGYFRHPLLSGQEAKSYFSMGYPQNFSWDNEKQTFDSLVVVLKPNGYSIGDTTVDVRIQMHTLEEVLETNDDSKLYNTSSFKYSDTSIASATFRPYPNENEELTMRIDDAFALEIINFLNEYENHVDKTSLFKDEYKGFVFSCDTSITRSVLGYSVSDSSAYIRLYSHFSGLEKEEHITDFSLASSVHFNQLQSHNKSIRYNQIADGKSMVKSQQTSNKVLLQSGSGLKFRVDFPTMQNLVEFETKGHIVKAELQLKPDMTIMNRTDLPSNIYIGDIYRANDIWGYLTDSDSNPLSSSLYIDQLYHEKTYYSFDLTNYINSRLIETVIDTDRGLVITLPDTEMGSTFNWLAINGYGRTTRSSKLLLYYYYYDTE